MSKNDSNVKGAIAPKTTPKPAPGANGPWIPGKKVK